ncbi:hypothetical protein CYMTET_7768, partial [Cymbomonas tetramitiformis]
STHLLREEHQPGARALSAPNFERTGDVQVDDSLRWSIKEVFASIAVSDASTLNAMGAAWRQQHYALCPHSAIAVHGAQQLRNEGILREHHGPIICVATAHVAKFQEAWEKAIGQDVPLPSTPRIDALFHKEESFKVLEQDLGSDWRAHWRHRLKADIAELGVVKQSGAPLLKPRL